MREGGILTFKRELGNLGEDIAVVFLEKHGFRLIERNYFKKWGEIDIVSKKDGVLRFIEVKTVSYETHSEAIPQETIRPEENMHPQKLGRLYRTIESYIMENKMADSWQIDLVTVKIDRKRRKARVEMIENIIME